MLLFLPLQPQNLVLSRPELLPGGGQLELRLLHCSLGLGQGSFGLLLLGLQGSFLGG